ncbi:MAG: HEPN domain-containing protein [Syntrophomonadaceae bacterium]
MAKSDRLKYLEKRIKQLERHLLPKSYSPTGQYTDRQLDMTRAYRLLIHSEFEAYLEDRAKETAISAVKKWKASGKPSNVIISLLAFCYAPAINTPDSIQNSIKPIPLTKDVVDRVLAAFNTDIKENNGVRERNILKILYPIGIQSRDLDVTWLNQMDSFGEGRGDVAHRSIRTQQVPDPKNEKNTVATLMIGIRDLDEKINILV